MRHGIVWREVCARGAWLLGDRFLDGVADLEQQADLQQRRHTVKDSESTHGGLICKVSNRNRLGARMLVSHRNAVSFEGMVHRF